MGGEQGGVHPPWEESREEYTHRSNRGEEYPPGNRGEEYPPWETYWYIPTMGGILVYIPHPEAPTVVHTPP